MSYFLFGIIVLLLLIIWVIKDDRTPVNLEIEFLLDTCHEQERIIDALRAENQCLIKALERAGVR